MLDNLKRDSLDFHDPPSIAWMRVRDIVDDWLWQDNIKVHDIPKVIDSIVKHGFQDLPKFDETLGAIKSGNGRIEALWEMEQSGYDLPRGLAREKSTEYWVMPIVIGTDAASIDLAVSYAIDANSLTLAGSDFGAADLLRLYDRDEYMALVESLVGSEAEPISVTQADLDILRELLDSTTPSLDDLADQFGDPGERDFWPTLCVTISPKTMARYEELVGGLPGDDEADHFETLLNAIDSGALI